MSHGQGAGNRGRKGGLERLRELLAVLGSLDDANDEVSPTALASRFDISEDQAKRLIYLLTTASDESGSWLPLYLTDEEGVALCSSDSTRGRPCRLTISETMALMSALDQIGVPTSDPARMAVSHSMVTPGVDQEEVERLMAPQGHPSTARDLDVCAKAILDGKVISMSYRGTADAEPRVRRIACHRVRHEEGTWYVDATDMDSGGERTFRLDRMGNVTREDMMARPATPESATHSRTLTVEFDDVRYLDSLAWPGLRVTSRTDGHVTAEIPYYGGDWLPRHIAACGGTARADDEQVMAQVRRIAMDELTRARPATSR
jgi:proteasome accessory factor C